MTFCAICGLPIIGEDLDDAHTAHAPECDEVGVCACSGLAHPDCCDDCGAHQ